MEIQKKRISLSCFRVLGALFLILSQMGCGLLECEHYCHTNSKFNIPRTWTKTHLHLGDHFNWKCFVKRDSANKIERKIQIIANENLEKHSSFIYVNPVQLGEYGDTIPLFFMDSIIKHASKVQQTTPPLGYDLKKNQQYNSKLLYYIMGIEPLDSIRSARMLNSVLGRSKNLKDRKKPGKWNQRIQELNDLHSELVILFSDIHTYSYPEKYNMEPLPRNYIYFDSERLVFIKFHFTQDTTVQLLIRPKYIHLLDEKVTSEENCDCCYFFQN